MNLNRKEWLFNGILAAAIVVVIALILYQRVAGPTVGEETYAPTEEASAAPEPTALDQATTPSLAADDSNTTGSALETPPPAIGMRETQYAFLGKVNLFRALITPTPTPTPAPATPTPTPSLQKAVGDWKYQYPRGSNPTTFVFETKQKATHHLEEGKPYTVNDGNQTFEVVPKRDGKWGVVLQYQDQQQKFSLIQ